MHRDFMYTAKKEFPALEFLPISTHTTRKLRVTLKSLCVEALHDALGDLCKQYVAGH